MLKLLIAISCVIAFSDAQFNPLNPLPTCPKVLNQLPQCDINKRYSEIDGSCNNLAVPWAGKASVPYKRYFPNTYDDGWNAPRRRAVNQGAVNQPPLQNPRVISRLISLDNGKTEIVYSHLLPLFGQFLAHDITLANTSPGVNCDCGSTLAECFSFVVFSNDNILRQSCIKFTRTQNAFPKFDCGQSTREQLNSLSSFIDGSQIYGSDQTVAATLRAGFKGQLKTSAGVLPGRLYLPTDSTKQCGDNFQACFVAGESRTNENLGLVGVQVLFMREHNRIAMALSQTNPTWSDETVFKEARKIVIAILQHIVYNEWLPLIVGKNYAASAKVLPIVGDGFFTGYDPNVNPLIANEFSTAAFRFGHTLMRSSFSRIRGDGVVWAASLNISKIIFRNNEAYNTAAGGQESIFFGLLNDPASKFDSNLIDHLQNHLFEFKDASGQTQAFDLLAMNINRGRDHGIASYNTIRAGCGLPKATDFSSLLDVMPQANIDMLKSAYNNVNDIDFYAGGLMEIPIQGGVVGPTFACIIVSQFAELKRGDRFFYENAPVGWSVSTAFTAPQLREIKKMTMSRIICNDYDASTIQPNSFLLPTVSGNQKISCASLPTLNMAPWKV